VTRWTRIDEKRIHFDSPVSCLFFDDWELSALVVLVVECESDVAKLIDVKSSGYFTFRVVQVTRKIIQD
jgi:hypothetical protein